MPRQVAPAAQWAEPNAKKTAGRAARFYPVLDEVSGVWGWSPVASQAAGIVVTESGALGVDDATTTGGQRVFGLNGSGPMMALGA